MHLPSSARLSPVDQGGQCFDPHRVDVLAFSAGIAVAQAPDLPEPGSVEAIAAATGDPRFLSPWVSYLPQSSTIVPRREISWPHPRRARRICGHRQRPTPTAAPWRPPPRAFASSPSAAAKKAAKSSCWPSPTKPASAISSASKSATAALADPRRTDQAAAEKLIATSRPIYYFNAALHSDETGSTEAMLELAYRLAVSEQPMIQKHPRATRRAHQSRFQSRRPRQGRRMVLPLPERQDRPRLAAAPVPAVLVEVRFRRHQPRHAPADARDHQGCPPHVSRMASHGGPRSARGRALPDDLERHRPLQPQHRSHHLHRISRTQLSRSAKP